MLLQSSCNGQCAISSNFPRKSDLTGLQGYKLVTAPLELNTSLPQTLEDDSLHVENGCILGICEVLQTAAERSRLRDRARGF